MNAPWATLAAIAALALVYVVAPIVADAFVRFGRKRTVGCPESGLAAEVRMDAWHAALTAVPGPPDVRVADCSLWPARSGCAQRCLARAQGH